MADLFGTRSSLFGGGPASTGLPTAPIGRRPLTLAQIQALRRQLAQIELAKQQNRDDGDDYSWRSGFGIPMLAGRAIGQVVGSLVDTPAGLVALGESLGHDTAKTMGAVSSFLGYTPPEGTYAGRVAADSWQGDDVGKAIAQGYYEDFRHPLRNIGYLGMDVAGIATAGAGTAVRTTSGLRRVAEMRKLRRAARRGEVPPQYQNLPPAQQAPTPLRPPNPIVAPTLGAQTPAAMQGAVSATTTAFPQQLFAQTSAIRASVPEGLQFAKPPEIADDLGSSRFIPKEEAQAMESTDVPPPQIIPKDVAIAMDDGKARVVDSPPEGIDIRDEDLMRVGDYENRWELASDPNSRVEFHPTSIRMYERDPVTGVEKESNFQAARVDKILGVEGPSPVIPHGTIASEARQGGNISGRTMARVAAEQRRLTGTVNRLQYALRKAEGGDLEDAAKALRAEADLAEKAAARVDKMEAGLKRRTAAAKREEKVPEAHRYFDPEKIKADVAETRKTTMPGQRKFKKKKLTEAESLRQWADVLDSRAAGADRAVIRAIEARLNGAVEKLAEASETRKAVSKVATGRVDRKAIEGAIRSTGKTNKPLWMIYRNGQPLKGEAESAGGHGGGYIFITGDTPSQAAQNAWAQLKRAEAESKWLSERPMYKQKDTLTLVHGGPNIRQALLTRTKVKKRYGERLKRQDEAVERIAKKQAGITDEDALFEEFLRKEETSIKTKLAGISTSTREGGDPVREFLDLYRAEQAATAAAKTPKKAPVKAEAKATAEAAEGPQPPEPLPSPPEGPAPAAQASLPKQKATAAELPSMTDDLDAFVAAADKGKAMTDSTGKVWDRAAIEEEIDRLYQRGDPDAPDAPDDVHLEYAEGTVAHRLKMLAVANDAAETLRANPTIESLAAPSADAIDTVIKATRIESPKTPRERYVNPRETGESLRQLGISPRQVGVNVKALRAAGIEPRAGSSLQKLQASLWKELKPVYEASEGKPPKMSDLVRAMRAGGLNEAEIKSLLKGKGGENIPTIRDIMREFTKAFMQNPNRNPGTLEMEYTREKKVRVEREKLDEYGRPEIDPGSGDPVMEWVTELRDEVRKAKMPLSRNAIVRGLQKWQYQQLQKHPESRLRALSPRTLPQKVEFELKQNTRMIKGLTELGILLDPEKVAELKEKAKTRSLTVGDFVDATNGYMVSAVLHLKPAYLLPNLLGQLMFMSIHHHLNPISMAKSVRLQRDLRRTAKSDAEWEQVDQIIRSAMEGGIMREIGQIDTDIQMASRGDILRKPNRAYVVGARRAQQAAQKFYGRLLDTPFRWNAFLHEAQMKGYTTAEDIKRMVLSEEGTPEYDDFIEIARRGNEALVDFGRMGKWEKQLWRRIFFIYPWIKGSTRYTGHFFSEHPFQAAGAVAAGRVGSERTEEILPDLPSYAQGLIPFGERDVPGLGRVPTVLNPNAFSILGSAADVLGAVRGAASGEPTKAEELTGFLNPAGRAILAATTRTDPFTKRDYPAGKNAFEILGEQLLGAAAPYQTYERIQRARELEKNPELAQDILFPMDTKEAAGRYLFGVTPYAINPKEAASRAEEEDLATRSPAERALARGQDTIDAFSEVYKGNIPERLRSALEMDAQREAAQAELKDELGHDLSSLERLAADLRVAVRNGKLDESRANQVLQRAAAMDDSSVDELRQSISKNLFARDVVTYAKRRAGLLGIEVPNA